MVTPHTHPPHFSAVKRYHHLAPCKLRYPLAFHALSPECGKGPARFVYGSIHSARVNVDEVLSQFKISTTVATTVRNIYVVVEAEPLGRDAPVFRSSRKISLPDTAAQKLPLPFRACTRPFCDRITLTFPSPQLDTLHPRVHAEMQP